MDENNYLTRSKEDYVDECVSKGICSPSPTLVYLHEVVFLQLRELAYYLLKLKGLGINNEAIKRNFIDTVSSLIVGINYSEEQFLAITQRLFCHLKESKNMYTSICSKNDLKCGYLRSWLKFPKNMTLSEAINFGHKIEVKKCEKLSKEQKFLFELMANVIKSICVHIVELEELEISSEEFYEKLLTTFDAMNSYDLSIEELRALIDDFADFDHMLLIKLHDTRQERYGVISPAEISASTNVNSAMLVSGTNLRELEILLEATKDKNIDIYTHGHMLMAHGFPKFREYKHLVGHFGRGPETYLLDFAEFPGPVFLTKHSAQKVESLYRSRIFTTDIIAPKGVTILKNNDFSSLIESAISSRGFTKAVKKPLIKIDLDEMNVLKIIQDAAVKFESGKYKKFFIIGVPNHTKLQEEYFNKFLNLIEDDCFVLSFSYSNGKKNILKVESDYGFPLVYSTLKILANKIGLDKLNPIFLATRCEIHTLSNIIYLKNIGVKNIYFTDCPPAMINPALLINMREMFNLKRYTSPESDYREMISQKSQ